MAVLELCSAIGRYDLDGENRMLDLTGKAPAGGAGPL